MFNKWKVKVLVSLLTFLKVLHYTTAIDCFKCVSIGGSNKDCDDPFHNNSSLGLLESPCYGGRKGRAGLFPATACLKLSGIYDESGLTLTVRSCALDSGTLTTDSELIRMSHCGAFYYDDKYVRGCVQSCNDADACNSSELIHVDIGLVLVLLFAGIGTWLCDTVGLIIDILLEFLGRSIELTIAILHLAFQVICFLRDICIEAMQTFANIFRGIVNVVGSIDSDDVEDFATACIVVILWIGAGRFILGAIDKNTGRYNPLNLFGKAGAHSRTNGRFEHQDNCPAIQENTWLQGSSGPKKKTIGSRKRNSTKY